jgi:hypothetical protein
MGTATGADAQQINFIRHDIIGPVPRIARAGPNFVTTCAKNRCTPRAFCIACASATYSSMRDARRKHALIYR